MGNDTQSDPPTPASAADSGPGPGFGGADHRGQIQDRDEDAQQQRVRHSEDRQEGEGARSGDQRDHQVVQHVTPTLAKISSPSRIAHGRGRRGVHRRDGQPRLLQILRRHSVGDQRNTAGEAASKSVSISRRMPRRRRDAMNSHPPPTAM